MSERTSIGKIGYWDIYESEVSRFVLVNSSTGESRVVENFGPRMQTKIHDAVGRDKNAVEQEEPVMA